MEQPTSVHKWARIDRVCLRGERGEREEGGREMERRRGRERGRERGEGEKRMAREGEREIIIQFK